MLPDEVGGSIPPQAAKINNMTEEKLQANGMYADRESLEEAFKYAEEICKSLDTPKNSLNYVYSTTAIMVIWNTLANKYKLHKLNTNKVR